MSEVYFSKDINKILDKVDFSSLGKNVAIKLHFGEKGCKTYLKPEIVKMVYDKIVSLGKFCTLVECNVLYRGSRTNSFDHIRTAKEHGFDFAPIDILDGTKGEEYIEVKLKKGVTNPVKIGEGIKKYDSLVVLTHFKGHMETGFGGALKNIGMGLGSRAGKMAMHTTTKPRVDIEKCMGCSICAENCGSDAIKVIDGKANINISLCTGCAMCIAVCPHKAMGIPWESESAENVQRKVVDYVQGVLSLFSSEKVMYFNFLQNITKECDCFDIDQKPIMPDIGVLFSKDIVSIDKASFDLVEKNSKGKFSKLHPVSMSTQTDYAAEKGLGEKKYSLVNV
jgi:uncharacterized Fe-S center protein